MGSSARMTSGSLTSARAMATRCCWPPESWFREVPRARLEPDLPQAGEGEVTHVLERLRRFAPQISGSSTFSSAVVRLSRVETLEDETELLIAAGRRARRG